MVDAPERSNSPGPNVTALAATLGLRGQWVARVTHQASRLLWQLKAPDAAFWFKSFGPGRGSRQAVAAYRRWVPHLDGVSTLVHVAEFPGETVVVLQHCTGEAVSSREWTLAQRAAIHRHAGAWLARLHAIPLPAADPMPLSVAIRKRQKAASARLRKIQASNDVLAPFDSSGGMDPILSALEPGRDGDLFEGVERVPCHRDYSPRNWLFDAERDQLVVLDFEHSAADVCWADIVKLKTGEWQTHPSLEQSFWHGYGGTPDAQLQAQLQAMVLLHGVNTLLWGHEHGDAVFAALGARILADVLL